MCGCPCTHDVFISCMQIERMHPFDSRKFGKVMHALQSEGFFNADQVANIAACSPWKAQLKQYRRCQISLLVR